MEKVELIKGFNKVFNKKPEFYIDTGGRFEICGNHTDHNHGLCLVANCSLRIKACVNKNEKKVRIKSQGYSFFEFDINHLEFDSKELNKTLLLAKGILFKLKEQGYKIGGFDAYISSDIPDGSGVSSSAAIESLFGYIVSYLYNDGKISPLVIAKTGQFSENNYFGKPSGLLDQVGTSFDSFNYIDFKNIENPTITTLPFNFPLTLYLIKSVGDHANLTPLYAAIPANMNKVAQLLDNKKFLRDCNDKDIFARIDALNIDEEVKKMARFLDAIRASQKTSKENIKNTFVEGEYKDSPQNIIDDVSEFIKDNGAIRIHGGGFKGTVLAFIKNEFADEFDKFLEKKYIKSRYFKVNISNHAVNFEKLK